MKKSITATALVLTASGCVMDGDATGDFEEVGVARQATTLTSGRTVPLPVLRTGVGANITTTINPKTNRPQEVWDATYSELLVADEYAKCVARVSGLERPTSSVLGSQVWNPTFVGAGPAFARIRDAANKASCPRSQYGDPAVYPPDAVAWALQRSDPTCNVDSSGESVAAIELPQRSSDSTVVAFQDSPEVPVSSTDPTSSIYLMPGHEHYDTVGRAYGFLYQAYVGLCFARSVNELLESSEVFTVPTEEHMLLLGLVHESAQEAMMKLGYLLKLTQKPIDDIPTSNQYGFAAGAWLRRWLDIHTEHVGVARQHFLSAVQLAASAGTTFASFLERQAGARWTTQSGADAFGRDWGRGSARSRLMKLVFGGGALDDLWGVENWKVYDTEWFSPTSNSSSDPSVAVMFNLAKKGDALYFRPLFDATGLSPATIDAASWESLYLESEVGVRQAACENADAAKCTKDYIRSTLPALSSESEFRLRSVYGLTLEHAKQLATSLFDAAVRHDAVTGSWTPTYGAFHVAGVQTASPPPLRASETGWIKLDKETALFPYGFDDRAQSGQNVCSPAVPEWDNPSECDTVAAASSSTILEPHGQLGAVSALAFAREVLFEQAAAMANSGLTQNAAEALSTIERLTGKTTILRRQSSVSTILPSNDALASSPRLINPAVSGVEPGLRPATKDPSYVGANGISRATLDSAVPAAGTEEIGTGVATGLARISWLPQNELGRWPGQTSLLLRTTSGTQSNYLFLSESRAPITSPNDVEPSATIVKEGWYADLYTRVTAVDDANWSTPKYDAFGLPKRWVPPADASLLGGSAGEESYQYLLRSARAAAEEATAAVKTANDNLAEEARDKTALAAAQARATSIASAEQEALCASTSSCGNYTETSYDFRIADITKPCLKVEPAAYDDCELTLDRFNRLFPTVSIPTSVAENLSVADARFTEYAGSELQRVLLRTWNAGRTLNAAREQMIEQARAHAQEMAAVLYASQSAGVGYSTEMANLAAVQSDIAAKGASQAAAAAQVRAQVAAASEQLANAGARLRLNCYAQECAPACICVSHPPFTHCDEGECDYYETSCRPKALNPSGNLNAELFEYCSRHLSECAKNRGSGDTDVAANLRCEDAVLAYHSALGRQTEVETTQDETLAALALGTDTELALKSVEAQRQAARAKRSSAEMELSSRLQNAQVQLNVQYGVIQQAVAELFAAMAELKQVDRKFAQSKVRGALEISLAQDDSATNDEIRRSYRSYDLWRARALLENARRLAVAARRSIEARFVVDLSQLTSEQAFVASPSIWADEVYESDLNAPGVVGLSQAPKIEGAIYPNKLIDYVGDLERFVQGYTITYPTSISLPDTEVITLGGPDQVTTAGGTAAGILLPQTSGWRFYCAAQKIWITHPGVGEYPITRRLDTACDGRPPTLAKIGFWLDPWGGLNGAWPRPQYVDRHNVRWRRLAVNLVGTGIRDCAKSTDSMSCYTNPFVRFDMLHAGPSWQTNHAGEWRALDIPTASIEAGKALAAEEWLEPVTNSWNMPYVSNVARGELFGRPTAGNYELVLEVTPDVRLDRIERIQLLVEQDYWVKQVGGRGVYDGISRTPASDIGGSGGSTSTSSGTGGNTSIGGATGAGGTTGAGGSSGSSAPGPLVGSCTPTAPSELGIDDFEDGNKILSSSAQRLGTWFGFHAGTCAADPATGDAFLPKSPSENGNRFSAHAQGSGCQASDWAGGGIGFNFLSSSQNGIETVCANYDASAYTGIGFDAKGNGEMRVEVCTSDVTDNDCHGAYFGLSSTTWTRYDLRWAMLTQNGWGAVKPFNKAHLKKIQFLSKTPNYDFDIDNVSFLNN